MNLRLRFRHLALASALIGTFTAAFLSGTAHSQAEGLGPGYFDGLDKSITGSRPSGSRLVAERYFRTLARLSVYALYCDLDNQLGLNTHVWNWRTRTTSLFSQAERVFGGKTKAYNRLERYRNDESYRFKKQFDQETICDANAEPFEAWLKQSNAQLTEIYSKSRFGQL